MKPRYKVTLTYLVPPKDDVVTQSVYVFADSPERAIQLSHTYLNHSLGDVTATLE